MTTLAMPTGYGRKTVGATIATKAKRDDGVYPWVISTQDVDYEGEVMVARGCNFKPFLKHGGGMYWHHNPAEFPLAKCIGVTLNESDITADITFPARPAEWDAARPWGPEYMKALVDAEMVRAVSVGFNRLDGGTRQATAADRTKYGANAGWVTTKWMLKEISFTTMPMNAGAVRKAFGVGSLTLDGCRAAGITLALNDSNEVTAKYTIRVNVPRVGALDRIGDSVAKAVARARGRVYWP